jgi:uncharacterized protein
MVRIVRTPEGTIELDLTGKKNGRGAYMCGKLDGFYKAKRSRALDRALKLNITPEVYDQLEQEFSRLNEKYASVKCELNRDESDADDESSTSS